MENKDRNAWQFGFTAGAENWNGRLAMIGFAAAVSVSGAGSTCSDMGWHHDQ